MNSPANDPSPSGVSNFDVNASSGAAHSASPQRHVQAPIPEHAFIAFGPHAAPGTAGSAPHNATTSSAPHSHVVSVPPAYSYYSAGYHAPYPHAVHPSYHPHHAVPHYYPHHGSHGPHLHHPHPAYLHPHPHQQVPWVGILFGVGVLVVIAVFLLNAIQRTNSERAEYRAFMQEVKSNPYREDPHQQLTAEELALTSSNRPEISYASLSPAALARYIQNNLIADEDEYVLKYWARIYNHMLGDQYARADRLLRQSYLLEHASLHLRRALRVLQYKIGLSADLDKRNVIRPSSEIEPAEAGVATSAKNAVRKTAVGAQTNNRSVQNEIEEMIEAPQQPHLPSRETPLEAQDVRALAEYIDAYLIANPNDELVRFTWYKALESIRDRDLANAEMQLTHSNFVDNAQGKLKEALAILRRKLKEEQRTR